jgi:hypothetical protein
MQFLKIKNKNKNKGYTLIETLFYVALFALLAITVTNSLIRMGKSFKEVVIYKNILNQVSLVEKIGRDIRQSSNVVSINTNGFNNLTLSLFDVNTSVNKNIEYRKVGDNLAYYENNIFLGNLNNSSVLVKNLVFSSVPTNESQAVSFSIVLGHSADVLNRDFNFQNTIVLRDGY